MSAWFKRRQHFARRDDRFTPESDIIAGSPMSAKTRHDRTLAPLCV